MALRATTLGLAVAVATCMGCMATFRESGREYRSPRPDELVGPLTIEIKAGTGSRVVSDYSLKSWTEWVFEEYRGSSLFQEITHLPRAGDWRVTVHIDETPDQLNTLLALASFVTALIIPSFDRTDFEIVSTWTRPDGTLLAPIQRKGTYRNWMSWFVLPFAFSYQESEVAEALVRDMLRDSLAEAQERGYFEYVPPPTPSAVTVALAPAPPRPDATRYGSLYRRRVAAVVGIDEYVHWPSLEGAVGDARRAAAAFRRLGFDEVIEVYGVEATRARILELLGDRMVKATAEEDLAVIFFAGHGQTETLHGGQKRGYIIPYDGSVRGVFGTAISMDTLRDLSNRLPAKHVYYAMDSCYSGLGFTRGLSLQPDVEGYVDKVTRRRAVQMVTAGAQDEQAIEVGGQGLFTTKLLEALDGAADFNADGYVTASEIGAYVKPAVSTLSRHRQTPQFGTLEGSGEVVFPLD